MSPGEPAGQKAFLRKKAVMPKEFMMGAGAAERTTAGSKRTSMRRAATPHPRKPTQKSGETLRDPEVTT